MPEYSHDQQRQFAVEVVKKLTSHGYLAYWAGGCVRDYLLGRVPKDYDVTTNALPGEIRDVFGHKRTLAIGAAFGVITVLGPESAGQIEVATFREDAAYTDGRHPDSVSFSTPKEDAQRRDFTINGMFYDPVAETLHDYVGGQFDLNEKVIRAIGDPFERFAEDKLRMLRAIRFAARLNFALAESTRAAIRQMANELHIVSAERIATEMRLILTVADKSSALQDLKQTGLLEAVMPEVTKLPSEAWSHALRIVQNMYDADFPSVLAALLYLADQPTHVDTVADRWKLSNQERSKIHWLVENVEGLSGAQQQRWSVLQPILMSPYASDLLQLHDARAAVGMALANDAQHCRELMRQPIDQLDPPPLLTGNDLIAHGVPRGKQYSELLSAVRNAQLDRVVMTKLDALALVDSLRADR